ncbi:MAG: MoaD/ThiS family protein [Desulfobacteraceae bacterium]|nr:MoaD/ThiS family protein [Desulfobacteraceae bacterium]
MFKQILGGGQPLNLEIEEGTTLEGLLNILAGKFGRPFEKMVFRPDGKGIKQTVLVIVNGTPHWNLRDRLASPLRQGDTIKLTPMVTGG